VEFTAEMEARLDQIMEWTHLRQKVVQPFYQPFSALLDTANTQMERIKKTKPSNETCDKCGSPMVIKEGRFGEFLACSQFPQCKNTRSLAPELNIQCPRCKEGQLIQKKTRKGKVFYGCSYYPHCQFAVWDRPIAQECPTCHAPFMLVKTLKGKREVTYCEKCKKESPPSH